MSQTSQSRRPISRMLIQIASAPQERALADRFAGRDGLEGAARFTGAQWATLLTGIPVLSNALAAFDCEVTEMLLHWDHAVVVGRVCAIRTATGALPLAYW